MAKRLREEWTRSDYVVASSRQANRHDQRYDDNIRDERSWSRQQYYHPRNIFLQDDSDHYYSRGHRDAKFREEDWPDNSYRFWQYGLFKRVPNPLHMKGGDGLDRFRGDDRYSREDVKHISRVGTSYEFEDDDVKSQYRSPYCFCCYTSGHKTHKYPHKKGLRVCGHGFDGHQFYSMHIPVPKCNKGDKKEAVRLIKIEKGDASIDIIRKEMVHIFDGEKGWKIKQMADHKQFMISFPDEGMIAAITNKRCFKFQTADIEATLLRTNMSYGSICCLHVVWVQVTVPNFAKLEDTIMKLAYIVGDPIEVDLTSLQTCGPARVKISCVNPQIELEKVVFLNGRDHIIKFKVENFNNNPPSEEDLCIGMQRDEDKQEDGKSYSSTKHIKNTQKDGDGKKAQQAEQNVKHKVGDLQCMGVHMEVLEDRLVKVVEGATNLHNAQGMDAMEPNKEDTDTSQMDFKKDNIDTNKTKISSGLSQTDFINPCATMKSTHPIKYHYSRKGKAKRPNDGAMICDNEAYVIPIDEATTAKDSREEINNQLVSTPKPSPTVHIHGVRGRHGVRGKHQVQRKLKLGEEDGYSKETIDNCKNNLSHFMKKVDSTIGEVGGEESSHWKGSVLLSVVGAILTQNGKDRASSDVIMNLAAKFPSRTTVHQSLINDKNRLEFEKLITSIREDKLSSWEEKDIRNIVHKRFTKPHEDEDEESEAKDKKSGAKKSKKPKTHKKFGSATAATILSTILGIRNKNESSSYKKLVNEAEGNGYNKMNDVVDDDPICWDAVLHAPFDAVANCLKPRGEHFKLAFWIMALLFRIKRGHGSLSLEWLKHVEPSNAREYLTNIVGLGTKCVELICLLALKFPAFPVDVNVSRIALRLQLVPPQGFTKGFTKGSELANNIHEHLWPIISNMDDMDDKEKVIKKLTKVHYQSITFGKIICTERYPNCRGCPLTLECKHYNSEEQRSKLNTEDVEDFGHNDNDNATEDVEDIGHKGNLTHTAYIIPDGDPILEKFEKRLEKDPNPYLLVRHLDNNDTKGTILIPCFTANKGTFPLFGSFFQKNEVFASDTPIEISSTEEFKTTTVYFGNSIDSITSDQTSQRIEMIFKKGYICVRGFDCMSRQPKPLPTWITEHSHALQVSGKARKRKQSQANHRHESKLGATRQRSTENYYLRQKCEKPKSWNS